MASANEQLKRGALVVGVFAVIGLGIGLTAYFPISYLNETFSGGFLGPIIGAMVGLQSILLVVLVAPVVAGIAGLLTGYTEPNPWAAAVTAGSGAFVGFYVMVLLAGVLVLGGFGAGAVAQETPTPTTGEHQFTEPPDYETPTPEGIRVSVKTATPAEPLEGAQSGIGTLLIGGIPAGLVGAVTARVGYWFRENSEFG